MATKCHFFAWEFHIIFHGILSKEKKDKFLIIRVVRFYLDNKTGGGGGNWTRDLYFLTYHIYIKSTTCKKIILYELL